MLTMCVYRQSTPTGNNERKINWDAVLDLVNATFTRFPSFVLSYPNGVTFHRLRGQYGGRHRPHATRPTEHTVSHWALEHDRITVAEEAEFTSHLDDLVEAERLLDLDPNSSARKNNEKPRIWWIEFNVAAFKRDYHTKYSTDYAAEDGSDSQGSQDGEEGQEDGEIDNADMDHSDQEVEDDGESGEESQQDEIMYEEPTPAESDGPLSPAGRSRLDDDAQLTGYGDSDNPASIPALINAGNSAQRARDLAGTTPSVQNARRRAPVARKRPSQSVNMLVSDHGPPLVDTFTHLISKVHAWPEIPMVHNSKVDRSTGVHVISTRNLMSGLISPEDIFVSSNSASRSSAGRVRRIWFHDHVND